MRKGLTDKRNATRHRAGKVDCPFVKPRKPGSGARDGSVITALAPQGHGDGKHGQPQEDDGYG